MTKPPLDADELLGSREIRFVDRQETNFPNLMRLCMDFDFCVLQLLHRTSVPRDNQSFILARRDCPLTPTAASPCFAQLEQLEDHVSRYQVDILHDYLFGIAEDGGA